MSSQSKSHSRREGGSHPASSGKSQATKSGRGYTIAHAGRQVRLGPVAFWTVVLTLVIMGVWSAGTATYFAF
ncbi:MAG: hypothetical protein QOD74_2435, partial [Variibacter sp.]|nr:hypothetical protein [Variibacter sp.]